jgi:hypothetical protein
MASLLAKRADDSISAVESRALKAHLLSCAACAEEAAAQDPTLLFLPLAVSAEGRGGRRDERRAALLKAEADRVVADVLAAVDVERAKRRLGGGVSGEVRQRRALLAASVALVGAGLLGYVSWKKGRESAPERLAAARPVPAVTAVTAAQATRPQSEPGDRPVIEDLKNPGATVYEFASASPQEPTLVFIVDRNADI